MIAIIICYTTLSILRTLERNFQLFCNISLILAHEDAMPWESIGFSFYSLFLLFSKISNHATNDHLVSRKDGREIISLNFGSFIECEKL